MGKSVATMGSVGCMPRKAHEKMTLKNGSMACVEQTATASAPAPSVQVGADDTRLDGVRERHTDS